MNEIIFSNKIKLIKELSLEDRRVAYYPIFQADKRSRELLSFLKTKKIFISADDLHVEKDTSKDFQEKFVNFIAELTERNHSFLWFGLNFINKNPLTTRLCYRTYHVLSILDLVNSSAFDAFLVVTDDRELYRQIRIILKDSSTRIRCAISWKPDIKDLLKHIAPLAVVFAFFRATLFKFYARAFCNPEGERNKEATIVFSLLNEHSFAKDGSYRDAFFGKFVSYLRDKNINVLSIVYVIAPSYQKILRRAVKNAAGIRLVAVDYFVKFSDLFLCLRHALRKYFSSIQLHGKTDIGGVDLSYLVKNAIRRDYVSSYFFDNLKVYYAIKEVCSLMSVETLFYPFENRAFERMIILALRECSQRTHIVGYQHASISKRHMNFLLGKDEHKFIPLPDVILTMGEITRNIMRDAGHFPSELLEVGCALRQQPDLKQIRPRKNKIDHIFVALSSNLEKYAKVLDFLGKAFQGSHPYQIWIRPHPAFSLDEAMKIYGVPRFGFYNAGRKTLDDCYQWADLFLYVHSTLSIEAIAQGLPVVNLDIDEAIDPDPLFGFNDFRWRVKKPGDLVEAILYIDQMTDADFAFRQKRAQDYARRYLFEANEEELTRFYKSGYQQKGKNHQSCKKGF